jgi:putative ABC transport system substrate-binding protein
VNRRQTLILLGTAGLAGAPSARAQQRPVVGWLNSGTPEASGPFLAAFRQGLGELGYVEGRNVTIEYLWAGNRNDRLPALAAELVARKVDVLVTGASGSAARAAKAATSTIPIVFGTGDPVAIGLVDNLARPGGNLTGVAYLVGDLSPKRLELLLQIAPQTRTVAMLVNPNSAYTTRSVPRMQEAARSQGVQFVVESAASESEIDAAIGKFVQAGAGALVVQADPYLHSHQGQLLTLAARHRLPAIYTWPEFPEEGGLMSYGPSRISVYRQFGTYAGRILKGTRAADLPVVQPTTFELVVNLRTAKALGLELPPAFLARVDRSID